MKTFEEICHYLEENGFTLLSVPGYRIQIYEGGSITVKVEK